jgi:pimeloyl-ACP methyl ester carboxylesterase
LLNDEVQEHFRAGGCGPATVDFAQVTCPALVLGGEWDPVAPAAASMRLADALPGARGEVLPGVGHAVFRQAPGKAFALVREFLAQLSWDHGASQKT